MKKKALVMILVLACVMTGCGKKGNNTVGEEKKTNTTETTGETTDTTEVTEDTTSTTEEKSELDLAIEEAKKSAEDIAVKIEENKGFEVSQDTKTSDGVDDTTEVQKTKPLTKNESGKVQIQCVSTNGTYKYNSYMITSTEGESIVIDPTSVATKEEYDMNVSAVISTHDHPDHVDTEFNDSYPDAKKLLYEEGTIETRDFKITLIPSSHQGEEIRKPASNYIALIEVDGLRIVHMGDVGQTVLTDEQMEQLGEVDVCFMQYTNSYSSFKGKDGKAIMLMKQVNPKVIIPTHFFETDLSIFSYIYGTTSLYNNVMYVDKDSIANDSQHMCRILNNISYQ
ncbi:MBL fold metallo-hydrolase [Anaerosporobacter sp.]